MCGVFGIFSPGMASDTMREQLHLGIAQLDHRGPDGWGAYFTNGLALGHTRLAIFDPEDGHQPMMTDDTVIVYNGEVYNHYELREDLEKGGITFRSHCDTEVIQRLYERDNARCLEKMNGQFALIVWDKKERTLFLARDRLGMRPLYVMERRGATYFSSEMKAFDAIFPGEREFKPAPLLDHALLWNTLGCDTVYKDIRSVASGTYERYQEGRRTGQQRYYEIGESWQANREVSDFDAAKVEFIEKLDESVQLRLRSDVPVGGYLSGGIDSTVISHLISKHKKDQFRTFSVEFEDQQYDESKYQKLVSEKLQSTHESVVINKETINSNFLDTIYHGERPIFRTAPVPMHRLSEKVHSTNIKVVLTGEGADEILFGYDTFKELKILDQWNREGKSKDIDDAISKLYPHINHYADVKQFGLIRMYYEGFLNSFNNDFVGLNIRINNNKILRNYFNKDWESEFQDDNLEERLSTILPKNFNQWSLLQKNSFLEIKTLLQGYLLSSQGDRMALGHSIEGRYPFLDHNLIEYAFSLPDEFKLNGFNEKYILKQAFDREIPTEIINRPKRPYVAPDVAAFFVNNNMTDMAAELLSPEKINAFGCFNEKMVKRFLNKFRNGIPEHVGYRDNMIFTFLLSTQCCAYWIKQPRINDLDYSKCKVEIFEYH